MTILSAILLGGSAGLGATFIYCCFVLNKIVHVIGESPACSWIPPIISIMMGCVAAILMGDKASSLTRFQRYWIVSVLAAGLSYWLTMLVDLVGRSLSP